MNPAPPYTDVHPLDYPLIVSGTLPPWDPAVRGPWSGRQRETQRDGGKQKPEIAQRHRGQGSWPRLGALQRENERRKEEVCDAPLNKR